MNRAKRRFLIAVIATVAIAASAGFVVAGSRSETESVFADNQVDEGQAWAPSTSAQSFFYFNQGDYTLAENLQDR